MLAPKIKRIVDVWGATKAGRAIITKLPDITIVKFPALWTETPLAQAQREQAIATRDSTYITAQVLLPDEVALARFRSEGFDQEIQLTEEAKRAREAALAADLKTLTDPAIPTPGGDRVTEEQPEPPPNPGAPLDETGKVSTLTGGGDMSTPVNAKPLNSQTENALNNDTINFDAGKPHVVEETTSHGVISHTFATKGEAMTHGMAMRTTNAQVYVHKSDSPFRDKNAVQATKEQTTQRVAAAHTATAAAHASVGNTGKAAEHTKIATANLAPKTTTPKVPSAPAAKVASGPSKGDRLADKAKEATAAAHAASQADPVSAKTAKLHEEAKIAHGKAADELHREGKSSQAAGHAAAQQQHGDAHRGTLRAVATRTSDPATSKASADRAQASSAGAAAATGGGSAGGGEKDSGGSGGGEGQSRDENGRWDAKPRTFQLIRHEDVSGASGTGEVFNGCVFTDGKVAGRWNTPTASTELWDTVEDMMKIHGHGGATELRYDED